MGIFDMISSFFNPQRGYQKAGGALDQYYNQGQGYLNPYNQQGQEQYKRLMEQVNALNDPAALQAKWAQSYQESPQAKQAQDQAKQTGMNEASEMGLMGSSAALGNIQQNAANISQQDRQHYLDDMMQKYMGSIGVGQNLYGMGANAAGQMGQNAMQQGQSMAGMQYGMQNAPGQNFGNILGMLLGGGMNIFGNHGQGQQGQYNQRRWF